jgi:hypothetical protein
LRRKRASTNFWNVGKLAPAPRRIASFESCLFKSGHFRDRLPQSPNLWPGSKAGQITLSNAELQSAEAAMQSVLVCAS